MAAPAALCLLLEAFVRRLILDPTAPPWNGLRLLWNFLT